MQFPSREQRQALGERYAHDRELVDALRAMDRAEYLLHRSLYEFGVELRTEIEKFLGETPLIPM